MNISFPDLRSFVVLAHSGNYHHAALALAVSQPTLTRRIQKLEQTLGVQLFDRDTRNVALSQVGREFLPKAQALLEEFDSSLLSISAMAEKTAGQITVAAVPTAAHYFLPRVLATYATQYPRMRVRIVDEPANVVLTQVLAGDADIGLAFGRNLGDDIDFEMLMDDPYVVACRPDHALAAKERVAWSELRPYPLIVPGSKNGNRLLIDLNLLQDRSPSNWLYEVQHLNSSLPLVEAGLGISVVSTLLRLINHNPNIVFRPIVDPTLFRGVGILRKRNSALSPAAQAFYTTLKAIWLKSRG
ncbi:LysR family transcriptional regulator [Bosea sp. BK604]|uniref:LysR family transcriptional regulator n=1 Tax=Bosea sp. BK604 TaxID=2512180 RepID=UPI0010457635|nr:LysR family transcriptional regulator [Bosea sp. BK604]TCR65364.1 LysR family transcriptional regulator [Bosea sp. BK604]